MERTFCMVKPDGVRRGCIGDIISRFECKGLRLVDLKLVTLTADQAARHYAEHQGKDFYDDLIQFITSGPVVPMILEGPNAVAASRALIGATDPLKAAPGTIRGDYGLTVSENIIHGADSPENADREIANIFTL
ncbi:nucleoside-diphosphate kinase [Peptococcus simiae]|uniref:Nucleoside diphosphate kinase n=1 Tax=Peptococcus simiae TaxID=1643805 RepID=A0ABW9GZH0_9FIRM